MKELEGLTLIRHGVSNYNQSKTMRETDPDYLKFRSEYERDFSSPECATLATSLRLRLRESTHESETPLWEEMLWQAEATGKNLPAPLPDLIVVSPYRRAQQTLGGMILGNPDLGEIPIEIDARIREREHGLMPHYGDKRIFFVNHPGERALFEAGEYDYRYPEGENIEDVKVRVADWLADIRERHTGKRILAVTHHETILVKRMVLEGLGKEDFLRIDREDKPINCGVTTYKNDGKGLELVSYNQRLF